MALSCYHRIALSPLSSFNLVALIFPPQSNFSSPHPPSFPFFLISLPAFLSFFPFSAVLCLLLLPSPLSSRLSLPLYSRKKVAINKAAMSYRQEKSRKLSSLDCSMTEQSTLQQDERMAHSFMDAHGCNARSKTARNIWVLLRKCPER